MSTKTTFKRIALVAVAALGFGTLSVAPSSAVALQKITLGTLAGVQTTTGTTAAAVTTLVNINGYCTYDGDSAVYQAVYTALPATSRAAAPALTTLAYDNNTYGQATSFYQPGSGAPYSYFVQNGYTVNAEGAVTNPGSTFEVKQNCRQAGRYNVYATLSFQPDVAGTYSILLQDPANSYTQTTWSVTVAAPAAVSAAASSVLMSTGTAEPTTTTDAVAVVAPRAASSDVRANIAIFARNSATANTATSTTISATITGPGLISFGVFASAGRAVSASGNIQALNVYSDGTAGVGTITISSGTTVLATKTVSFAGAAATLAVALKTANPTWIAPTTGTTVLTVSAKDAAGIAATVPATTTATSSATTVATVGTVAGGEVTVTGVAAGTAVITIADSATGSTVTSATYTVTVKPATTTAAATLTFDKTEYNPGELMTITVGADVADNAAYAAFTALPVASANLITVKNPFGGVSPSFNGTVALVSGKATWTAYAPLATGPLTLMATTSAGPATAATVTATATIISDGVAQAAVDAAAEATDAANAATDAANAAAEAADAATAAAQDAAQDAADAVAALSTQVAEMIDALKKQITALTNLVIKIQKKVKA
jgi:hypothetical protein